MRLFFALVLIAALLPPRLVARAASDELRAFWVDAFNSGIKTPAQVTQLVADARAANANALIVQVRRRGDAYYLGGVEPRTHDPALAPAPYDPLGTLLAVAHAHGIEVHAWIATLPIWRDSLGTPPAGHILESHGPGAPGEADWVMYGVDGETTYEGNTWIDPGHPAVVAHTEAVVRDILGRYPALDGLHLDLVRYPSTGFGYNPVAVARFNARYGRTGTPAPDDPLWADWRREQVTGLVRRVALATSEAAPHARLSAAVIAWGDGPAHVGGWEYSAPYKQVLQDWRGWLAEGLLDTAVVMNYDREERATERAYFDHWLAWETSNAGGPVVVGPAAYLNSVEGTLAQVARAQAAGASGIALYSYATTNKDGQPRAALLQALAAGPFAESAAIPPMPWKDEYGTLSGSLDGVPELAGTDGISVKLDGPDARIVRGDGAGWFGAVRLAPGEYTALVGLDDGRIARSSVLVVAGSAARAEGWEVVTLGRKTAIPMIVR